MLQAAEGGVAHAAKLALEFLFAARERIGLPNF